MTRIRTIYVEKNIPRILAVKLLGPLWPDVIFSPLSPVRYTTVAVDGLPGSRWVQVRNRQCGICGSDLALFFVDVNLSVSPAALPTTERFYLGHEVVGEVVAVGADVTRCRVGDRVIMDTRFQGPTCLSQEIHPPCRQCQAGNYMLCENVGLQAGPRGVGGGWGDGFIAHETEVYRIPDELSDERALLVEPLSTGVRAVLRRPPSAGEHAVIVGCGTIGLCVLQCLKAISPETEVTVLARYPHQAQMARSLGADHVLSDAPGPSRIAESTGASLHRGMFKNVTMMGGFDVVYDCVGSAETLQTSLRWARAGGAVVLVGITLHPYTADLSPVWHQEVDLVGVHAHGAERWDGERRHTYDVVVELLQRGRLCPEPLITHRFALRQWKEAIKTAVTKESRAIKVIFDYSAKPVE